MMNLEQFRAETFPAFQAYLKEEAFKEDTPVPKDLLEAYPRLQLAMHYSLENGGKRVRPLLLLAACSALGVDLKTAFPVALALEYVHTYSLIHDDLPAMDNDDYRRGQLTNHKKFDEATAILAGDALLSDAFNLLALAPLSAEKGIALVAALSQAIGSIGMVQGQMLDMQSEHKRVDLDSLKRIHSLKTGRLLHFAIQAALILSDVVDNALKDQLLAFADHFGIAFQIHNDIVDQDQDEKLEKSTYCALLGLSGAKEALEAEMAAARDCLNQASLLKHDLNTQILADFLNYLA